MSYVRESGIYKIKHRDSGKCYVGSAVCIAKRWWGHRKRLGQGTHHSAHLQNAWNKYGSDAFEFMILERVERSEDLIPREQAWIELLGSYYAGYNMSPTAGSPLGVKHTAETRAKIAASGRGRKHSAESIARMSAAAKIREITHLHTPEVKAKAKAANKREGRACPEYVKKVLSEKRRGMKFPPEWRAAISASQRGVKRGALTPEHRTRISIAALGRQHSAETREKLSDLAKRRGPPKLTPEQISRGAAKRRGAKRTPEQIARIRAGQIAAREAKRALKPPTEPAGRAEPGKAYQQ